MSEAADAPSSLHGAGAAVRPDDDGAGIAQVSFDDRGSRVYGSEPSYGFRVRLGRERTPVARCSWCTMPIVEAEVDPVTGKPFMQEGRPYHQECRDYRR
jgi:hypothetical protein